MKLKKIIGIALSIAVVFTFTCVPAFADSTPSKDESVYVITEEDGNVDKVTVSERLKIDEKGEIKDESNLKDIKNIKGDEEFTQDGSTLTWKAQGEDIYYQGSSNMDLPVEMKVTYYLNGIKRSPEKMGGKSGRVKIVISFDTAEGVPFVAISGASFPQDSFSDVTVSSGDVITNGENYIVAGIALPGLETITSKLDNKIGGNIVIKADCTDFEISDIYTIMTNEGVEDINMADTIDELDGDINKLVEASKELKDGSSELSDGISSLDEKYDEMDEAVKTLSEGAAAIDRNVGSLADGMDRLAEGSGDIYDGMVTLQESLELTYEGVQQFTELSEVLEGIDLDQISGSIEALDSGIAAVQSKVGEMQQVTAKEAGIISSQEQIISQLKQIKAGYEDQGIPTDSLDAAITALEQTVGGIKQTNGGEAQYEAGIYGVLAPEGDMRQGLSSMQAKLGSIDLGDTDEISSGVASLQGALKQEAEGAEKLAGYQKELTANLDKAANGAGELATGTGKLSKGANELKNGSSKVKDGLGQLNEGGKTLSEGMAQFDEEGIGQIKGMYDDTKASLDDFNAAIGRAKAYESYGGNAKGQEVKTKFIIRTKGVAEEEEE